MKNLYKELYKYNEIDPNFFKIAEEIQKQNDYIIENIECENCKQKKLIDSGDNYEFICRNCGNWQSIEIEKI